MHQDGLRFDQTVAPGGYAWWYVDAVSDDGRSGITVIAFIGSVFSSYYALARARGNANPEDHCALNIAMWHDRRHSWCFTERNRNALSRDTDSLSIGASALRWDGSDLIIDVDERQWPTLGRVRGSLRVSPPSLSPEAVALDPDNLHRWWPAAPRASIEVDLRQPAIKWRGEAYLDHNAGSVPLETSFRRWDWSRVRLPDHTAVFYDVDRLTADELSVALIATPDGEVRVRDEHIPGIKLPPSRWRLPRNTRAGSTELLRTVEDGPFYARSLLRSTIGDAEGFGIQETLSLQRLKSPLVRFMVPFRNPRNAFGH